MTQKLHRPLVNEVLNNLNVIFNQKKYGKYHLKLLRTCQILYI